jgi:hypothetical protein
VGTWGFGGIVYIQTVQCRGQDGPCDTHACISQGVGISPSTIILYVLQEKNELISFIMLPEICNSESLYNRPRCQVESNTFSISKITAAVDIL